MKTLKRPLAFALAIVMLLTLCACGQKFDPEELTASEKAAKAVVESIEFNKGEELKEVDVLQADDIAAALGKDVELDGWDISDAAFAVILRVGEKTGDESTTSASDSAYDADAPAKSTVKTSVALVSAENKVLYCSYSRSSASADTAGDTSADTEDIAQDARYELAQKTVDAESYAEKNAEAVAAFEEAIAEKLAADPEYYYTTEYINTAKSMRVSSYADMLEQIRALERYVEILEQAENGDASELLAAKNAAAVWKSLEAQRWEILGYRAQSQASLDSLVQKKTDVISAFEAEAAKLAENDTDYMYSVDYLKLCLSSEDCNQYDVYKRQIAIYQESEDCVLECMELDDTEEITFRSELLSTKQETESEYVNALKTYVQCVINKEAFESENQAAIAAYDTALKNAKDKSGDNYAKDMDFIKADVQYGEIIKQRDAHVSAVENSKAAADEVKTEGDEQLGKIETAYNEKKQKDAENLAKANLLEYCTGLEVTAEEYDVESGQWGKLPQEYLDYQNPLLEYYTPTYSSSSGSHYSGSYSSGKNNSSSSSGSGNIGAGGYEMPNSSDKSFSDYIQRVDPDLYNSIVGRYDSLS